MKKLLTCLLLPVFAFSEETIAEDRFGMTGQWGNGREYLKKYGIDIVSYLKLDDTWNLHGGRKRSDALGNPEYVFSAGAVVKSKPLFHYSGGTFVAQFLSHHGKQPSKQVGSFVPVDEMEAPGFDTIYALWYRQGFYDERYWLQLGKSDAYDHFTVVEHAQFFINGAFTAIPTIAFFPVYPHPAMSALASFGFLNNLSLTLGLFDGSLADGYSTGKHGVIGRFFDHLGSHAFTIGELDGSWEFNSVYKGTLGIGGWNSTAKFERFSGGKKRGTSGGYATLDQVVYHDPEQEGAIFLLYGWADPKISPAHNYYAAGAIWQGLPRKRPKDMLGIGISSVNFTRAKEAEYTERFETAIEAFYVYEFAFWGFLQPDFQYIVHPGGKGLPNATVFTLRLQFTL
ncbi:MAG: carbohydrate porin [Chlamydiales bacterium]|nr:carbohydrate porin [Chlamydiales bacterium]